MKINRNLEQLEKLFFYVILTSILFILIYNIIKTLKTGKPAGTIIQSES